MYSIEVPAEVTAAFDALQAAEAAVRELDLDRLEPAVRLYMLAEEETSRRGRVAWSHDVIGGLALQFLGPPCEHVFKPAESALTPYRRSPDRSTIAGSSTVSMNSSISQ